MFKKEKCIVVKKSPSSKVAATVAAVQAAEPVQEVKAVRGEKKFTSEQYLTEYRASVAAGETWKQLCDRTGFALNNVRQCVTQERSTIRQIMKDKATASPQFMAQLAKAKTDVDIWADKKAEEKLGFLKGSDTRNTAAAQRRDEYASEELSL